MLELGRLHDEHVDFAEWTRQLARVDVALTRLCDAIDAPRPGDPPPHQLARAAYMAVLALGQLLHGTYSDDPRTAMTLELTRRAVAELLDALAPYAAVVVEEPVIYA